jgi:pyruvate dehydrogenase E1 component alpha subunit
MSDPAKYRSREEVQAVRDKSDPIEHAKRELIGMGAREEDLKKVDAEIKRIVVEAADFAEQSPEPDPAELYTDILVGAYD